MSIETSPDSNKGIAKSPFSNAQGAADAAQTAQEGARFLAEFWIEQGVCFTSGHVVNALRKARGMSLMVNQRPTGQAVQDYFTSGDMPSYDDGIGGEMRPLRKLRRTTRTDTRTPVGTEVYVYGPTEDEIDAFEFEIDIAEAPRVSDGLGGQTSAATAMLNATPGIPAGAPGASPIPPVQPSGQVAVANGKQVPGNVIASIHADGRLCIPRLAFEVMAFHTGQPVKGGTPLHVAVSPLGDKLTVSQRPFAGSSEAAPTTDRLRLHLTLPTSYTVGQEFEVVADPSTGDLVLAL